MPSINYAPYSGRKAVARAMAWVGRSYLPQGMCQRFTNEVFLSGSVGDWDGDGDADALDGWKKAVARGHVVRASQIRDLNDIPAAVMVYFAGGRHGHACVGVGGRKIVSTDLPVRGRIGLVDITAPTRAWGHAMLGYVTTEGNGRNLGSYVPGSTPIKPAAWRKGKYRVATAKLNARTGPSVHSKIKQHKVNGRTVDVVRPRGYEFNAVKKTKGSDGREWFKSDHGLWYCASYCKRV